MPIAVGNSATVKLSFHDFRRIEKEMAKLKEENTRLRKGAVTTVDENSDPVRDLSIALRAAIPVVQFAVGQLNPESVKNWPHEALRLLSEHMATIYADNADSVSMAITFSEFAAECKQIDEFRAERTVAAEEILAAVEADAAASETAEVEEGEAAETETA